MQQVKVRYRVVGSLISRLSRIGGGRKKNFIRRPPNVYWIPCPRSKHPLRGYTCNKFRDSFLRNPADLRSEGNLNGEMDSLPPTHDGKGFFFFLYLLLRCFKWKLIAALLFMNVC